MGGGVFQHPAPGVRFERRGGIQPQFIHSLAHQNFGGTLKLNETPEPLGALL